MTVIKAYGGQCVCCGESDWEFLEIDHVHNNGAAERKKCGAGRSFYNRLIKQGFPPGYQVLCPTCNKAKGNKYKVCPHQVKIDFMLEALVKIPLTY